MQLFAASAPSCLDHLGDMLHLTDRCMTYTQTHTHIYIYIYTYIHTYTYINLCGYMYIHIPYIHDISSISYIPYVHYTH